MVELKKKLIKLGTGYAILVPKALIECKVLNLGEELTVTIKPSQKASQNDSDGVGGIRPQVLNNLIPECQSLLQEGLMRSACSG